MTTRLLHRPAEAAALLRAGGTVAFPTETVYGLGADAFAPEAIAAVFRAKGRPPDNPLIVHLAAPEAAGRVARRTPLGDRLLAAFAPGPITVVLPSRGVLPPAVTAGLGTVAVRVPSHPDARGLLREAGPLVAPSANRSGRPSPTAWEAVRDDLGGRISGILVGEVSALGLESTVVDATGGAPVVLRPGGVSLEALRAVEPLARLATPTDAAERSPGTRHRHYAPLATVRVVSRGDAPAPEALFLGLDAPLAGYGHAVVYPSPEAYARGLYAALREADARGMARVDAQAVPEAGIGRALMDRLRRAAAR